MNFSFTNSDLFRYGVYGWYENIFDHRQYYSANSSAQKFRINNFNLFEYLIFLLVFV
jgi:hypothetical protein